MDDGGVGWGVGGRGGGDSIIICRYLQTDTYGGAGSIIMSRYIDRHTWMGWWW